MTEFTTDVPMRPTRRHGPEKGEYRFYFAIILLVALPVALLTAIMAELGVVKRPDQGIVRTAWSQANIITPKIFWA